MKTMEKISKWDLMIYVYMKIQKTTNKLPLSLVADLFIDAKTIDEEVNKEKDVFLIVKKSSTKQVTMAEYKRDELLYKTYYLTNDVVFIVRIQATNGDEYLVDIISKDEFIELI